MRVFMNGYPNHWLSPYTIIEHIFFWKDWSKCARSIQFLNDEEKYIPHPAWVDKWADRLEPACNVLKRIRETIRPQIRYVKIDPYDTWSMDHTLAHIIHPMLIQLQATKHGAPFTDDEDVPERLQSTLAPPKANEWDTDEFHFARWDWILDEMIWAFEKQLCDDDESQFYDHSESDLVQDWNEKMNKLKVDREGLKAHQARKANGFRLFGKYYSALWD
jgi:hypothetical protein